jgi:hypothetical protein
MAPRFSPDIDELYGVRPESFVRARNALAARLGQAGRTSEAAAVKRLPKPTAPVWAINQAARGQPASVNEFIDAFERLKRAQSTESDDLSRAIERERNARQHLVEQASRQLAMSGTSPSAGIIRRLAATLLGAAADPDARSDLRQGRLTQEREAPGFELLAGAARRRPANAPARPSRLTARGRAQAPATRRRTEDQRRDGEAARVAEREARERRRRAQALECAAAAHHRAADKAERTAEKVRQRLRVLEQRAAEKRRVAEEAARQAEQVRGPGA